MLCNFYVIENKLTGLRLYETLFKQRVFYSAHSAQHYIERCNLNPEFFEVIKIVIGGGRRD